MLFYTIEMNVVTQKNKFYDNVLADMTFFLRSNWIYGAIGIRYVCLQKIYVQF